MARKTSSLSRLDLRSPKARRRPSREFRAPRGWLGVATLVAIGLLIAWGQGGLDGILPEASAALVDS